LTEYRGYYPARIVTRQYKGEEVRIFLADADRDERLALLFLLDHEPGMEVVGIAIRSEGLAAQVRACRPDVLLLDWNLVTQPAADCLSDIHSLDPQLKIVVLHVHPEVRQEVESAGADVFISKDTPPDELLMVLRKMRKDELRSLH